MRLAGEQGEAVEVETRMTGIRAVIPIGTLGFLLMAGTSGAQEALDTPFNDHFRLTAGLLSATADTE